MKSKLWKIGVGDKAVDETIKHMRRLAKRDSVDPLIIDIAGSFKGSTDAQIAKQAYRYIVQNVPYVRDPEDREQVTAPVFLLNGGKDGGDCDCMSTLFASFMLAYGIPVWCKVIAWRKRAYTHVYNLVMLREQNIVIPIDCVLGSDRRNGFGQEKFPVIREKVYPM